MIKNQALMKPSQICGQNRRRTNISSSGCVLSSVRSTYGVKLIGIRNALPKILLIWAQAHKGGKKRQEEQKQEKEER